MRIRCISRGVALSFLVTLLVSVNLCYGDEKTAEVVGLGECADCKESNIKTSLAVSGNTNSFIIMWLGFCYFLDFSIIHQIGAETYSIFDWDTNLVSHYDNK